MLAISHMMLFLPCCTCCIQNFQSLDHILIPNRVGGVLILILHWDIKRKVGWGFVFFIKYRLLILKTVKTKENEIFHIFLP